MDLEFTIDVYETTKWLLVEAAQRGTIEFFDYSQNVLKHAIPYRKSTYTTQRDLEFDKLCDKLETKTNHETNSEKLV